MRTMIGICWLRDNGCCPPPPHLCLLLADVGRRALLLSTACRAVRYYDTTRPERRAVPARPPWFWFVVCPGEGTCVVAWVLVPVMDGGCGE